MEYSVASMELENIFETYKNIFFFFLQGIKTYTQRHQGGAKHVQTNFHEAGKTLCHSIRQSKPCF